MGRSFRIMDSTDGNRQLDKQEFYWGIKDMGVNISKREAEILIEALDTDCSGTVNYDEFLVGLRGSPNEKRCAVIDLAFAKFDVDNNGRITSADLSPVYDCSFHPKI
jgi:Ca2+-binding EF-hand superfamily protein